MTGRAVVIDEEKALRAAVEGALAQERSGDVRLGDVMEAFGAAGFAGLITLFSLIVVTPLSGVPLVSSVMGVSIALIAGQAIAGRSHPWLPGPLRRRAIPKRRLGGALERTGRLIDWLDDHTRRRLKPLTRRPLSRAVYGLCLLCGALMPVLELIPFTSSIAAGVSLLAAFGLLARDGVLVIAAFAAAAGLAAAVVFAVF